MGELRLRRRGGSCGKVPGILTTAVKVVRGSPIKALNLLRDTIECFWKRASYFFQ